MRTNVWIYQALLCAVVSVLDTGEWDSSKLDLTIQFGTF